MLFYKEGTFEYYFFDGVHPVGVGSALWPEEYGNLHKETLAHFEAMADPSRRTRSFKLNGVPYRVDTRGTFKTI